MADESGGGRGSFWNMAGLFRPMAGPFADLRGFEEWATWGSRNVLEALFESVRSGLIGRRVDMGVGDGRLSFTLSALDARLDPMATAAGQADDVSLTAEGVEWSGMQFAEVTATLSNVHTRPGIRPSLVCAPVDLAVLVSSEQVASVLATRTSKVVASGVDAGRVRLRLERHPSWGWMDVRPVVVSGRVRLRPIALGWKERSWRFKRRLPSKTLATRLPENARIMDLDVEAGGLRIQVRIDQWRLEYSEVLGVVRKPR